MEALMNDMAYAMSVENSTAVNVCVFNMSTYHHVETYGVS